MFLSVEMLDLVLYCLQQLGVMLAVGSETVILIGYVLSMRDGVINETEARFSRAVHRVLAIGIISIVASGIAITLVHGSLGEDSIIFAPVFLFKWLLIVGLIAAYITQRGKPFSHYLFEGAVGGTWYALFVVHILAPITSWFNLLALYAVFLAGFMLFWTAIATITRKEAAAVKNMVPVQKFSAPPPPVSKPVAPPQVIRRPEPPMPPVQRTVPVAVQPILQKTAEPIKIIAAAPPTVSPEAAVVKPLPVAEKRADPIAEVSVQKLPEVHHSPWLPAIYVMPKTKEALDNNHHITTLAKIIKPA